MKILSIDAETNGLWGKAFAIAAILYDGGKEIKRFAGRCPIEGEVNMWVAENVLPQMTGIPETHGNYAGLLEAFAEFYLANKGPDVDIVVHMGLPVEAKLFIDAHRLGFIGDWDAPYPLIDISAIIGTSVDEYNNLRGISVSDADFAGGTHNPLYDAAQAARAYQEVKKRRKL